MKKALSLALAAAMLGTTAAYASHKQQGAKVADIRGNAKALERDAAVYQRKSTSAEVGRIVRDVNGLQKALAVHGCLKAEAQDLQDACSALRSAHFGNDPDRTIAAAKRLASLADDLLTKDCTAKP